jgi:homoserine/homoserine lactone efflux protein
MLPIDWTVLGTFALAAGAVVVSPGPDTVLIVRNTLTSGRDVGLATVVGVQLGLVGHTLLAVAGISVIIASSPVLFRLVAVAGAAYLAWIGLQSFRDRGPLSLGGGGPMVAPFQGLRDAILCNLLNPKVILLFLALFPNFVDTSRRDTSAQLVTLAATLIVINVLWQAPLALAAQAVRRWLDRPGVQQGISRGTGAVLIALAALMLYENLV